MVQEINILLKLFSVTRKFSKYQNSRIFTLSSISQVTVCEETF